MSGKDILKKSARIVIGMSVITAIVVSGAFVLVLGAIAFLIENIAKILIVSGVLAFVFLILGVLGSLGIALALIFAFGFITLYALCRIFPNKPSNQNNYS